MKRTNERKESEKEAIDILSLQQDHSLTFPRLRLLEQKHTRRRVKETSTKIHKEGFSKRGKELPVPSNDKKQTHTKRGEKDLRQVSLLPSSSSFLILILP